jgi:steroid Delta-isomerase
MTDCAIATQRLAQWFEQLSPALVATLPEYYATDASFKDPFSEVQGLAAITQVFDHMYVAVRAPRFVVTGQVTQGDQAFLLWDFYFGFKQWKPDTEQLVRGTTHLRFNAHGLVVSHRDYWDAAEELYEKLPVVGGVLRLMKRYANK